MANYNITRDRYGTWKQSFNFQPPPGLLCDPPPDNPQEAIAILKDEGNKAIGHDPNGAYKMYSDCIEIDDIFCVLADRDRAIIYNNPQEAIAILKDEGNKAIGHDPNGAYKMYSDCIEIDDIFRVLADRDRAIIYSNRSQASMKLNNFGGAFNDAIECVKVDPCYVKGYWRAAMVMKRMNRNDDALEALIDGLDQVRGSGPPQLTTRVDFVLEITLLSSQLEGTWKKAVFLFRSIKVDTRVWTEVVKKLAEKKDYTALHMVFLGGGGRFEKGKGGMASSCSTKGIGIKVMVRGLSLMQLKDWGIRLIHQLIIKGAAYTELSLKDGDTPLHCALNLALYNGWFVLFEYLLKDKYIEPQSRNLLDRTGSSLYHVVAKSTGGHELTALLILRRYRVSPFLLDRQSRTPLHYATRDNIKMGIKQAIDEWRSGNSAPSQRAQPTQPQQQARPQQQTQPQQQTRPQQQTQTHPQQQQTRPQQQPTQHQQQPTHPQQQPTYPQYQQQPTYQQPPQQQQQQPFPPRKEPKAKSQEPFRWEAQTQGSGGYDTYTGQPYWETQQQRFQGQHWQPDPDLPNQMEIERLKQVEKRKAAEKQRMIQKEWERRQREDAQRARREAEERRTQDEMERRRMAKEQRRLAEEQRQKVEEEKREKKRRQKEQRNRRAQDLGQQSLYQQGLYYAEQKQYVEAVTCFAKFISENHANQFQLNDVERSRKAFAKQLPFLNDIPEDLICDDSPHCWKEIVDRLASEEKWKTVSLLIQKGSFAYGCDCSNISIASFLKWNKSLRIKKLKFVQSLLENQARPNGLLNEEESPMVLCIKNHNYDIDMLMLLLEHGAYPSQLSVNPGDTALHAALRIGFAVSDRRFKVLNLLLEKFTDPSGASYLNPSVQDVEGNGLFHLAIKEGTKNLSLEAVKLLSKHKVNPQLANKKGEIPLQMVKRNDRRYPFLTQSAAHHPKPVPKPTAKGDNITMVTKPRDNLTAVEYEDAALAKDWDDGGDGIRVGDSMPNRQSGMTPPRTSWKDQMKREISCIIEDLPPFVAKRPRVVEEQEAVALMPSIEEKVQRQDRLIITHAGDSKDEDQDEDLEDDDVDEDEEELLEEEQETKADVEDLAIFDNLTWEVECTAKVWKILKDRHVQHRLKQGIVRKIQLLGNGDWRPRLCKKVEGLPRERDMKLFEAKLTSGGRILWELAIAFSPRCSEESEKRLEGESESNGGASFAVAGGRIYSEIIRIWDIVFDHDNLSRGIETIVKSYERGKECIIQKKLVGIDRKEFTSGKTTQQRVPMFYRETSEYSPHKSPTKNNQQLAERARNFFPPASSKENEYHIMKFYCFNASLVNAILTDSSIKVDFPFRVTELEHAIINLQPRPPSSVLLLGRSGTGKTTCCLYRLWSAFVRYWKLSSDTGGEPLLPREVAFIHRDVFDEEEQDEEEDGNDDEESGTYSEASYEDSTASSASACQVSATQSALFPTKNGDETDEEDEEEKVMDHLHQVFITKNGVLCSEVQRNFRDLSHACEFAQDHCAVEDNPVPMRLQDAHPAVFPLFLNSRQFLVMLDGSLANPYFPRNEDGSLKRKIQGWGKDEGPMDFIPILEDEDDESDGEHSDNEVNPGDPTDAALIGDQAPVEKANVKYDPRREVTYEVFAYELWQRINKKTKLPYHPTLVWMEITSFIKGSVEALHTDKGHLPEEKYQDLGRKRAPNFTADRGKIYKVFLAYEHEKRHRNLFDEADLVFHIYRRMRDIKKPDWAVHQFYIDETQDFTQAELSLIIRCCHDPNGLFLTGDTAQSIMRGVAFRFDDLKSLFYYASKSVKSLGKHSKARVPKRVYQLTHNYRSHAGILNLAVSVVDLMFHFFPNSFDRLDRDQGLFDGPSPVLLESCSFSDLALLLRGNKRKTSEIEFGAHQVILVANEEAKEKLPAELSLGLVLTIFEAKGLEFDDVLLYNIFKDSPADKEWRVVTEYLDELIEEFEQQSISNDKTMMLHTIDIQNLNATDRPRPLKFDPDKHKVLNSELKYLYTAITRARVNVWLFDEDETARAPMFEYFRRLRLVKVVQPDVVDKGGNSELDSMFVETSSQEEWDKRGDYFYEHNLWLVAAKCYQRAGQEKKELKAQAHHRALEAKSLRDQPTRMREEFLAAALAFLQCGEVGNQAARCLFNAKEFLLSAQLFEKTGEMLKAAKIFENRAKKFADASRCYEQSGDYAKAIELLALMGSHIKAADVVERFQRMKAEYGNTRLPSKIKPPRASDTVENLCHQAANYHHKQMNMEKMMDALTQLPKFEDRINFLKKKGLYHKAVGILKDDGRFLEAAKILRSQGKLEEACDLLDRSVDPQFIGECYLGRARKLMQGPIDEVDKKMVEDMLVTALDMFAETKDQSRYAEARWMLGVLKKDDEIVKQARRDFVKAGNPVGEVHAADSLLSGLAPPKYDKMRAAFYPLDMLLNLVSAVAKPKKPEDQRRAELCDTFYGIEKAREGARVSFNKHEGARVQRLLTDVVPGEADLESMRRKIIINDLIPMVIRWVKCLRKVSREASKKLEQCPAYVVGLKCVKPGSCQHRHEPYPQGLLLVYVNNVISLLLMDDIINKARKLPNVGSFDKELAGVFDEQEQMKNCEQLYYILFPQHCHPRQISERGVVTYKFFHAICYHERHRGVAEQMKWYVKMQHEMSDKFSRKGERDVDRRANTDVWLQVWNVHRLFDKNTKVMEEWVAKEEKYCNDTWKSHKNPLGMIFIKGSVKATGIPRLDRGKRTSMYMSYMQMFFESFGKLYSKDVDALAAVASFNRFLGAIATHPVEPLLPSIRNVVSLLELWLTISLTIIARVSKSTIVLPASYLAQLNFYDALCSHRFKNLAIYHAISQVNASYSVLQTALFSKLSYMVDLVCAYGKFRRFNILGDAFRDEDCIRSGEAERAFVFTLVILCNVGPAFHDEEGTFIRELLQTIPMKNYPPRLAKALESIRSAKGFRDGLVTLQNLLQEREDEFCFQCEWKNHLHNVDGPGLLYARLNPSKFMDKPYKVLDSVPSRPADAEAETTDKEDDPDDVEISAEVAERVRQSHEQLKEQQMEDDAASKIQHWARQVLKKLKLLRAARVLATRAHSRGIEYTIRIKKETSSEQAHSILGSPDQWMNQTLGQFYINEAMCTICNVTLQGKVQAAEAYRYEASPDVELEEDAGDQPESPTVERPPSPELPAQIDSAPTKEEHERSPLHQDRLHHFNAYKLYLLQSAYPVIRDCSRIEQIFQRDAVNYKSAFSSGKLIKDEINKQRIDLYGERLYNNGVNVYLAMEDIKKRQAWEQFSQQLNGPISELHNAVEQAKQVVAELEYTAKDVQGDKDIWHPEEAANNPTTSAQPEDTGAFEGDEYDHILQVTQEPEKGIQGTGRQRRKQKSRWTGPRTRRR